MPPLAQKIVDYTQKINRLTLVVVREHTKITNIDPLKQPVEYAETMGVLGKYSRLLFAFQCKRNVLVSKQIRIKQLRDTLIQVVKKTL